MSTRTNDVTLQELPKYQLLRDAERKTSIKKELLKQVDQKNQRALAGNTKNKMYD